MNDTADQIMQELIERLGLARNPFLPGEGCVFFVGGQRRFLVQQAVHALYFASGIVLLSGAEGAGKTRIVDEVCRELAELVDICRIDASVLMDGNEVRQRLASVLGLASDAARSDETLLAALEQLKPDAGDPLPVLLVIDDAHQLAVTVLAQCYQLASSSMGRIRLCLVGAPELLLAWAQAGHLDADQIDVLPLDAQETADYVVTCLQAAGYRGEMPLLDEQLRTLHRETRGNIGAVEALAPALLLDALGGRARPARRKLLWLNVAIVVGVVGLVAIAAIFFRGGDRSAEARSAEHVEPASGDRQSIPLALPAPPVSGQAETGAQPMQGRLQPVATATSASPAAVSTIPVSGGSIARDTATALQKVERVPGSEASQAQALNTTRVPPVTAAKAASVPVAKPAAPPAVKGGEVTKSDGAKSLAALPSSGFVVQLMAAYSKPALDTFLAGSAKEIKTYTYETRRDGKPWYVAVTGPYPDRNAARAAIAALPKALRDQNPWPRAVTSIQADLRAK